MSFGNGRSNQHRESVLLSGSLQVGKIQNLPGECICGPQPLGTKSEQYVDDNKKSDQM